MPYNAQASLFRTASAVIPLVMSCAALCVVLLHLASAGSGRTTDEGTDGHVFQLLIAGQAPIVAHFALKWMPRLPSQTMFMLALQAAAALIALAPVVIFDL